MTGSTDLSAKQSPRIRVLDITIIALFVALTTVGAYFKMPGPIVPFSLQTFFVVIGGMLLGPWRGLVAQLLYVTLGLIGIPVFTKGGGLSYVLEPTFGYIIGFVAVAFLAGALCRLIQKKHGKLTFGAALGVALACQFVIYLCGVGYYWVIQTAYFGTQVPIANVLYSFVVLFLLTDTIGSILIAFAVPRLRKAIGPYIGG